MLFSILRIIILQFFVINGNMSFSKLFKGSSSLKANKTKIIAFYPKPDEKCNWPNCIRNVIPSLRTDDWSFDPEYRYGEDIADSNYIVHEIKNLNSCSDISQHKGFNKQAKTLIFIHGFLRNIDRIENRYIIEGFLKRGDHNIFMVDWRFGTEQWNYFEAVKCGYKISALLAVCIETMLQSGLSLDKVHLVGFSMGCHIAAVTVQNEVLQKYQFPRLTALDPPSVYYRWQKSKLKKLHKGSAKFVEVMHTNGGGLGTSQKLGHLDYYPNGGMYIQPGCKFSIFTVVDRVPYGMNYDGCSHVRSLALFYEIVTNPETTIYGRICDSWKHFKKGNCDQNKLIPLQLDNPIITEGQAYFYTAAEPLFRLGLHKIGANGNQKKKNKKEQVKI